MRALEVSQLSFGYGADPLFSGVTFALEQGERAAIVAPNGAGKSTLLRVIAGEIAPDRGAVVRAKGASLAYFRQSHELAAAGSVRDAFLAGFADVVAARAALEAAQRGAASGTDEALAELSRATDAYHLAGGDELEHRIERIASHLGFRPADMDRPVESLSGGERGRLSLGVVLAREADLLLLDEPTNHLDLETTEWLERHLRGLGATVIVVSHDRAFLDATCPTTLELGRRGLRVYPLSYGAYEAARLEDLERERAVAERQEAFVAKTEDFIRKNIAGQKTKQAQSRRKMLDKLERVERPEDVWARADRVRFRFADCARSGDVVLEAEGLGASRGGRELFAGLDLRVKRGERVAIVGRNGAGKTTLLRRLAGIASGLPDEERPPSAGGGVSRAEDAGEVRRGAALREGYFDQHLGSVDPARTGVEEIRTVRGDLNADGAREYLARFGFTGDDPLRRVSGYSGGERSRLALAKLLLEPRNLLFLDEPTNHLDIPATRILEEALVGFEGTVVFVSHDRRFLENVATRVVVVDGEVGGAKHGPRGALVWPGTFRDWVEARARQGAEEERAEARPRARPSERPRGSAQPEAASARAPESPRPEKRVKRSASTAPPAGDAADEAARRRSFEADRAAARARERKERRVRELEAEIAKGEGELAARREELKGDPGGDWEALARKAQEERSLAARVDAMMSEWARLSEELGAAR